MRMLHFDWLFCVGKNFGKPVSAVSFDLNAVEMRTAEYCIYLTKFYELLACRCTSYSFGELNMILRTCTFV